MPAGICILGFGSPHGDDQAGWQVVKMLQRHTKLGAVVRAAKDPLQLIDLDQAYEALIIVDACSAAGDAGTISRIQWPDVRIRSQHGHSSHSVSVAEALFLADQINRLPERVVLFGIETGECSPASAISDAVASALPALEQQILQEVHELECLRSQAKKE